ncbi:tetraspanin-32 isoform X3 [Ailuropoda melanoleuca]|uniref:tetraspanin-32 isoform X3 n=1 Tax=Ailuropoda melanoleuca TaxID=9646 RepID=UPI001494968C|nr:tetraspanin-32 isoform X3 [Ailuropoda melanoleuca]
MATMGPWSRVRAAKCQMLVTSFLVLLLGLSMATLAALTYFGAHFAVLGHASSDRTPYEAVHRWAFYACISLAGLLTLGAVLGAAATVREAGGLMAGGFLCFALVFGALAQAAFWRLHSPTQVEDAMLDAYDLLYDRAVRSLSSTPRQQLLAIQDTFLCCGKSSPFSLLGDAEASLCRGEQAARQGVRETQRARGSQPHAAAQAAQQTPKKGLPGEDRELPEDVRTHRLHPDRHRPRRHGVCNAAQRLSLVLHSLWQQPGPQGQIHPEPEVGPCLPPPPHPQEAEASSRWRRPGAQAGSQATGHRPFPFPDGFACPQLRDPGPRAQADSRRPWLPAPGAQHLQTLPGGPRALAPN